MQISVIFTTFLLLFLFKFSYFIKNTNCDSQLWLHGQPWVTTSEGVDLEEHVQTNILGILVCHQWGCKSAQFLMRTFWQKSRANLQKHLPIDPDVPFIGIYLTKI